MVPQPDATGLFSYLLPLFMGLGACAALAKGLSMRRRQSRGRSSDRWFFLAGQLAIYGCSLFLLRSAFGLPGLSWLAVFLPLFLAVLCMLAGRYFRIAWLWILGVLTPLVGDVLQKLWFVLPFSDRLFFYFPHDPIWYLLAAAAILLLPFIPRMDSFWEEMEPANTMAGCLYGLSSLAMLSFGQPGVLTFSGVSPHIWAVLLLAAGAATAWAAHKLQDTFLLACGGAGSLLGVVAFILTYPWGTA